MRTTITLEAGVWEDARRLADSLGATFSELVEQALRERLARADAPPPPPPFALVTFGGDGLRPGVAWADVDDLASEVEIERMLAADAPR